MTTTFTNPWYGTLTADTFSFTSSDEEAHGQAGDDTLNMGGGNDAAYGGADNDTLNGEAGDDLLDGGEGDDQHYGGEGMDHMMGNAGADHYDGGANFDIVDFANSTSGVAVDLQQGTGSAGDAAGDTYTNVEEVRGSDQDDVITGSDSAGEFLKGAGGNDVINGGGGSDHIFGGTNGAGKYGDILSGGADKDVFYFEPGESGAGGATDVILDFKSGEDLIWIEGDAETTYNGFMYGFTGDAGAQLSCSWSFDSTYGAVTEIQYRDADGVSSDLDIMLVGWHHVSETDIFVS